MLSINILTPEKKEYLKKLYAFALVKYIVVMLSVLLIITVALFYGLKVLLQNQISSYESQIQQERAIIEQGRVTSTEEAIQQLNAQLTQAKTIQEHYIAWLPHLQSFIELVPPTVHLRSLVLSTTNQAFFLTGLADSREGLINFEETVKSYQFFTNVVTPLPDVTQKTDINFEMSGQLIDLLTNNASQKTEN